MVFQSWESGGGDLACEVSSCSAVETVTKVVQGSAGDLQSETPSADPGGQNTKEKLCDSLTNTKTVGQADKSYHLAGPHAAGDGVDAKANSLLSTANQTQSSTEAFEDAAPQTEADDSRPDADDSRPDAALAETQTALAPADEVRVERESARPNGPDPVETHQRDTDGAQERLRPPQTSGDGVKGQSSEVLGVETEQVRREVKSAATQTEENTPPQQPTGTVLDAATQTDDGGLAEEEEEEEDEAMDSPCPSPEAAAESEKRLLSSAFPIPADPVHLAERIRRNRNRMSAAYDDTEYEPYGLPEVVMKGQSVCPSFSPATDGKGSVIAKTCMCSYRLKTIISHTPHTPHTPHPLSVSVGFADIPSGPACPYVLRRGLLGTSAVPLPEREEENEVDP